MSHCKRHLITMLGVLLGCAMLLSGCQWFCEHQWAEATCTAPRTCKLCDLTEGEPTEHHWQPATCQKLQTCSDCGATQGVLGDHKWMTATCSNPDTCTICGETRGEPLPHSWIPATCTTPMRCSHCTIIQGSVLPHDWTEASYDTPSVCTMCSAMDPLPLPESGVVFIGEYQSRLSKLRIENPTPNSYYIKLKDANQNDVFSFFVRTGTNVTMPVPQGYYYVYFACGRDWYGTQLAFGSHTEYSKDDELLDFVNYTYTYTLYTLKDGNFTETPIDESEF